MIIKISPYRLPSDRSKLVTFRKPIVQDAMNFCTMSPDYDESVATEYLNELLVDAKNCSKDTAQWSVQDRKAALIWIYVNCNDDTVLNFEYTCQSCGNQHLAEVDLVEMSDEMTQLDALIRPQFDFKSDNSKEYKLTLFELTGEAAAALQLLSQGMDELSDEEQAKRRIELKIEELMHRLSFSCEPKDKAEALKYRFELLCAMSTQSMKRLLVKVNELNEQMRHGYHNKYVDGIDHLVTLPLQCEEKKEDKNATQRLMFPAKCSYFIQTL